jgi:hypothetical protein
MKRSLLAAALSIALIGASATLGQGPNTNSKQQLLGLAKEVQTQQTQIADNQAKIDAKLAEIAEAIRLARIYVSREE